MRRSSRAVASSSWTRASVPPRRWRGCSSRPAAIAAVLLTHFHSDHIGGLGTVNLQRWVADAATEPMRVIGPPGVERVVAGLNEAYALDRGYAPPTTARRWPRRRVRGCRPSRSPSPTARTRWRARGGRPEGDRVRRRPRPRRPAVGYRFDYRGRSAVISGDTVYAPALVRVAQGADLLLHDALSHAAAEARRGRRREGRAADAPPDPRRRPRLPRDRAAGGGRRAGRRGGRAGDHARRSPRFR